MRHTHVHIKSHPRWASLLLVLYTALAPLNAAAELPPITDYMLPPIPGYQFEDVMVGSEAPRAPDRLLDAHTFLREDGCYEVEAGALVKKTERTRSMNQTDERTILGRAALLRVEVERDSGLTNLTVDGCFEPERIWFKAIETSPRQVIANVTDVMIRWGTPITVGTADQLWRFNWNAEDGEAMLEPWMTAEEVEQKLIELHGRSPWPEDLASDGVKMITQTWWAEDGSQWFLSTLVRDRRERWWLARITANGTWEILIDPATAQVLSPQARPQLEPWIERGTVNINSEIALLMQGSAQEIRDNMLVAYNNPKLLMEGEKSSTGVVYTSSDGRYYGAFKNGPNSPATDPPFRIRRVALDYSTLDLDQDGLTRAQEDALGSSDSLFDSDGDTSPDAAEVYLGTNPVTPDAIPDAPLAAGRSRAIMEWEPLRHYRVEEDGIKGLKPPAFFSLSRDEATLCTGSACIDRDGEASMRFGAEAFPPPPLLDDDLLETMETRSHPSIRQTFVWSRDTPPKPIFNPMHMARSLKQNVWPVEVRLKGMHALPNNQGYVILFDSNEDEVPNHAILNNRFGLVGEPFMQGMPSGIQGTWNDEALFAASEVTLRRASSNPEGSKCICVVGGCICFFEKTRERYIAAPEVKDHAQYMIHAYPGRGLQPGDVVIADDEGSLWRRTPEGAMVMWLHTRRIQRALNLEDYQRPRFTDIDATRDRLCVVSTEGRAYTISLDATSGEFASIARVGDMEDVSACAHDTGGALILASTRGELMSASGEVFASLPGAVGVHELWQHPGSDHMIALGRDEALHCVARDGKITHSIRDVAGATQRDGITYMLRRSGELVGADTGKLCTPDAAIERLLGAPFQAELWRQLYMGIMITILDTHTVSSPEVEMVARAHDHILVALNKTEMDTSAFVGTVTPVTFRFAPSYPQGGEVMGLPEQIAPHMTSRDFFSLADDGINNAMALIPGDGPPPVDYWRDITLPDAPEMPEEEMPEQEETDETPSEGCGQCASAASHAPAPRPWSVLLFGLAALLYVRRRGRRT